MTQQSFFNLLQETQNVLGNPDGNGLSDLSGVQTAYWDEFLKEGKIGFNAYQTGMGSLVFESVIEEITGGDDAPPKDRLMEAIRDKFYKYRDKRCEVGQVKSHIRNRNKPLYEAFSENARAVVLILDKNWLAFREIAGSDEVEILNWVRCDQGVRFNSPDGSGKILNLCSSFFYSSQLIPDTNIFGTGCMVTRDTVVTAGHVVHEAAEVIQNPADLIFIRGHFTFGNCHQIRIKKGRIYQLDQSMVDDNRIVLGATGDAALLKVKPYFNHSAPFVPRVSLAGPGTIKVKQPVYSIGHGFGVPAKLSFGGNVEHLGRHGWIGCDLDIFPGNSGSPIFHSNSHELLGVVSGPDTLWQVVVGNQNCIDVRINNTGAQTVQATRIGQILP